METNLPIKKNIQKNNICLKSRETLLNFYKNGEINKNGSFY